MFAAVAAVCAIALPVPPEASADSSFVTRAGNEILLDGQPFRFTGMNIYNANSSGSCWYPLSSGSGLDDALNAIGPEKKVIRAWFFQSLATTGGVRDWSAFDHTLSVAAAHGVKVIATLTNQWGDCESPGGYKNRTWYTTGYTQPDPAGTVSYRDWVAEVVNRYKNNPTVMAWQLVNEAEVKPTATSLCSTDAAAVLKTFATDVSGLIKSIDPNHLTNLGTLGAGQCGTRGTEYQDVNDVPTLDLCEYHDYISSAAMPGDQNDGLQTRINQCNAIDKPLFVGEMGVKPNDVGGTLPDRADVFVAKLQAQFQAGVVGEVAWAWSNLGSTLDDYDIGPGDPAIATLQPPPPGYPRPRGATPIRVPLVPGFTSCASSNDTHRAPLAYPSCTPPVQASPRLTVGTPDSNGAQANSVGSVRLKVLLGTPSDVGMGVSLSDVRCRVVRSWCGSSNTFGGADYTGELMSKVPLRITDRMNRDAGTTPATVGDISVLANVSCSQTADASLGSTCALDTSVNAIIPGAVVTGERAIWETGQIEVLDAGPDGNASTENDNGPFARQGVFVP